VLSVELAKRVVRENPRPDPLSYAEQEGIPSSDRAGRRGDELPVCDGFLERWALRRLDPVTERSVNYNRDAGSRMLGQVLTYCLVKLLEAWGRTALGRNVRAVDDDIRGRHD
jgi:hypothetical protein